MAAAELAVRCDNVTKRFYFYEHRTESLRELFIRSLKRQAAHVRRAEFTLSNFSLSVQKGECVALIGPNGSGKSTALRLIAGIYQPSLGSVETKGRLAAVIELGAGFHPDLTGAENVALYGAAMGLTQADILARFDGIVRFAEIGDFIDVPVKYYSSGMQARLAFAVTVCIEPDILLLDEVLAVGDQSFRQRCLDRLAAFKESGKTLVIVSHDLDTLSRLCSRGVWLEHGELRMAGEINPVINAYRSSLQGAAHGN